jgi:hypothetical protein
MKSPRWNISVTAILVPNEHNFKITYPADLPLASFVIRDRQRRRELASDQSAAPARLVRKHLRAAVPACSTFSDFFVASICSVGQEGRLPLRSRGGLFDFGGERIGSEC